MFRVVFALGSVAALAACASGGDTFSRSSSPGGQQFAAGPSVISAPPMVSGPAGCAGPIGEYISVVNRDSETGSLSPSVFNRVSEDLDAVRKTCASNREKEALTQLASVKRKYGYR